MMMSRPRLACCNLVPDADRLREFALDHGFDGVDWSFTRDMLPRSSAEETRLVKTVAALAPLEVRYRCAFYRTDLGSVDAEEAQEAGRLFHYICRLVSKLGGRYLTIHVGLGLDSTVHLSWSRTIEGLTALVRSANNLGIRLCLENLAWGWSSRPGLFGNLIRESGTWATFDIGHAQVCESVRNCHCDVKDFVLPHADRFLNAHVYHEEKDHRHLPPSALEDIEERLQLLCLLPRCRWWVVNLRKPDDLLRTLRLVQVFLNEVAPEEGSMAVAGTPVPGP